MSMVDQPLFSACHVPLQVQLGVKILCKNERPSSIRYCRPIKLICQKKSTELIISETENINSQILAMKPIITDSYKIFHKFNITMLDGKTFSVLAEAAPKNMNNLDLVKYYEVDADLLKYGLSTLHAWTFERMSFTRFLPTSN